MFGYNAVEDKGRRQAPAKTVQHENKILTQPKRDKVKATAQDQMRNHSLLGWMARKQLDYVSRFHVSIRSGNETVDSLLSEILHWHGAPKNIDVHGRFGRDEMFRLLELEKILSGDAALSLLDELKMQSIESDLIRQPKDYMGSEDINSSGLVLDDMGRVTKYCINKRADGGKRYEFHQLVDADDIIFAANWTRFGSQFRGVSPLTTAINTVQDLYEALEWNLIKAKMHALFGVAIIRDAVEDEGMGGNLGAGEEVSGQAADTSDSHLTLDPKSINVMDLDVGEDIKTIESSTPSAEFVEGSHLFVHIAMLALDIPVTFFDSRRSSFSARIADLNEYEVSCDAKRTQHRYVRQEYSDWLLREIWDTPGSSWRLREVAEREGFTLRQIQSVVDWVPAGSPWMDKLKQVMGDREAISLGLDNAIDAARRRGSDVFANIDKQAQVLEYAAEKGVPIVTNSASNDTILDAMLDEEEDDPEEIISDEA